MCTCFNAGTLLGKAAAGLKEPTQCLEPLSQLFLGRRRHAVMGSWRFDLLILNLALSYSDLLLLMVHFCQSRAALLRRILPLLIPAQADMPSLNRSTPASIYISAYIGGIWCTRRQMLTLNNNLKQSNKHNNYIKTILK